MHHSLATRALARAARLALDPRDWERVAAPALADLAAPSPDEAGAPGVPGARALARVALACAIAFTSRRAQRFAGASWLGLAGVAAATAAGAGSMSASEPALAGLQLAFLGGGLLLAAAVGTTSAASLRRVLGPLGWLAAILLLVTSVAGIEEGGVRRWLAVGPLTVQVSHLVWPLVIAPFALARPTARGTSARSTALLVLPTLLAVGALVLQGDAALVAILAIAMGAGWFASREGTVLSVGAGGVDRRRSALVRGLQNGALAVGGAVAVVAATCIDVRLADVTHVEHAWGLLAAAPLSLVVLGVGGTLAAVVAPLLALRHVGRGDVGRGHGGRVGCVDHDAARSLTTACAVALAGLVVRPFVAGGQPVAFLGYGGSVVIGAALAIAIVVALQRDAQGQATAQPSS